ncbi:MAG: hypothetical protein Fur006_58080 [Coleofasciculaceae cyanobacterium]
MVKLTRVQSTLLVATLFTISLEALPIQAAIRQQPQQLLTKNQGIYLANSVGNIVKTFRRKKTNGGGRPISGLCAIAPVKLVDRDAKQEENREIQKVWSDRPLFLWNSQGGTVEKIELFLEKSDTALWSREFPEGATSIIYDGKPLQPGQTYEWQLTAPFPQAQPLFRVMDSQEREEIKVGLKQLEEKFKGASTEKIALEKANYFAEQELWSDALRELYSVPNPSAELRDAIAQIQAHDFCKNDALNSSALR